MQEVQETQVRFLGWECALKMEMATHSSILAWETPRTEEHGGLQPMRPQKDRHNLVTRHTHTSALKSVVQQWIPSSSSSPPCTAFKWLQLGLNGITGFKQSQICCHLRRLKSVQFKRLHPDEAEFHLEPSSEANLSCLYWLKIFCKAKIEFNLYLWEK